MKTLYIDMDGVVADFDKAAMEFIGFDRNPKDHKWKPEEWARIRNCERWFRDLPKTLWADELIDLSRQLRDQCGWRLLFLTAIPAGNDFPYAFNDKILWAQKYYPDITVHFGPYSKDKQSHCKPGDVLVDDRIDNCQQWQDAGGTAIRLLYRVDPMEAVSKLRQLVENEIKNKTH